MTARTKMSLLISLCIALLVLVSLQASILVGAGATSVPSPPEALTAPADPSPVRAPYAKPVQAAPASVPAEEEPTLDEEVPPPVPLAERPPNIMNPLAFEHGQTMADFAEDVLDEDARGEPHSVLCVLQAQEFLDRFEKIEVWMETGKEQYAHAFLDNPELSWPDVVGSCL